MSVALATLLDARLAGCRRLFLRNVRVDARIGIHDFELAAPQPLAINVDLWVPLAATTPHGDDIAEVVDYDFVRAVIHDRIARGHVNLQETLCDELAATLVAHSGVRAVRVSTEKPAVYPDCDAVGVEVWRFDGEAPDDEEETER